MFDAPVQRRMRFETLLRHGLTPCHSERARNLGPTLRFEPRIDAMEDFDALQRDG
jgi:hypothetical protein